MACGTPVVGIRGGGLLETVVDGETGFLVDSADPHRYADRLRNLDELSRDRIVARASAFSPDVFVANVTAWIADATA
ncbi:D-inositol 3-phosphate glycosyltransferase [compost metagenome]